MADDEKNAAEKKADDEKLDIDEPDIEIASDEDPEDKGNKSTLLNNLLIGLALAAAGGIVFWASYFVGKKTTVIYRTSVKDSSRENPAQTSKERSARAVVSKGAEPTGGEVKSEPNEPAPATKVDPASAEKEKVINPFIEKEMASPAKKDANPVSKAEVPVAAGLGKSPQAVKPAAVSPAVKPAIKPPKPAAGQKPDAKKLKKVKEYKIIAGAFSIKANADSLAGQLKANNYDPLIVQAKTPKGQLYRVIAGSYRSLDVTKTKMGELKKLGVQPFYIVE